MSWLAVKAFAGRYRIAFVVALLLALCGGLFGGGYHLGTRVAEGACAQAKTDEIVAAHADYVRQVEAGASAVQALTVDLAKSASFTKTLQRRLADVQVLAPRTASSPASDPGQPQLVDPAEPVARLSAGAVSLWNSALAGADVPAGACGADDPTAPACAAAVNATPGDAWANHAENADLCRSDRLTLQRLQTYLTTRASLGKGTP